MRFGVVRGRGSDAAYSQITLGNLNLLENTYIKSHWTGFYAFSPNNGYFFVDDRSELLFSDRQVTLPWQPNLWPN